MKASWNVRYKALPGQKRQVHTDTNKTAFPFLVPFHQGGQDSFHTIPHTCISRTSKFIEAESILLVSRNWGKGNGSNQFMVNGFPLQLIKIRSYCM